MHANKCYVAFRSTVCMYVYTYVHGRMYSMHSTAQVQCRTRLHSHNYTWQNSLLKVGVASKFDRTSLHLQS